MMRIDLRFGRTRHARFVGEPRQVLIGLGMVLAWAFMLTVTLTLVLRGVAPATRFSSAIVSLLTE